MPFEYPYLSTPSSGTHDSAAVFDVKLDSEQMVRTLMMLGMGDVDMLQGYDLVPPSLSTEDVEAWLARP